MKGETNHFIQRRDFLLAAPFSIATGLSACSRVSSTAKPETTTRAWESLINLARFWVGNIDGYKVDPYLRASIELQGLGKDLGSKVLYSFVQEYGNPYRPTVDKLSIGIFEIAPLCRMLFAKRQGSEFRRAGYGSAVFVGRTDYVDWPLDPIEIIDGVPFNVVVVMTISGQPEYIDAYISYCLENCDWNNFKFEMKNDAQKQEALKKLFELRKLKNKLSDWEIKILSNQIQ